MQNVSAEFKAAIKAPARILKIRANIQAPDLTVYTLTAEDLAQGGFYYKAACMEHDFALGGATAASCTLTLTNHDKQWDDIDLEGGKLTVFCGVVTGYEEPEVPEDPEEEMPDPVPIIEDVLMGTFIIDRQTRPYVTVTLSAADRLVLLDRPLTEVPGVIYPITARALLTAISSACGVPLDNSLLDIEELDEINLHKPEYDGVTCRDALGEIALLCGGFARCTREGAIEIVQLVQPESESAYVMTKNDRFDFRETTERITLTGLKYGDTIIGEEGYILEVDRMYMVPDALALSHLQALWLIFDGFTYTPCTAQYKGNPAIDTGDPILHVTRDGEEVLTFVGRHTYTFGGRCTIDSYGKSKSEQKYISANTRRISGLIAGVTHDFDQKLSDYEQASAQMSDLIGLMMGVYPTQEPQQDGSVIYYWHDQPTLEESMIIWRLDKNVFTVSDDGGQTWTGQTSDGTVIAKVVHALDITADQIVAGVLRSVEGDSGFDLEAPRIWMTSEDGKVTWEASSDNPLTIKDDLGNFLAGIIKVGEKYGLTSSFLSNTPDLSGGFANIGYGTDGGAGIEFQKGDNKFIFTFSGLSGDEGVQLYLNNTLMQQWAKGGAGQIINDGRGVRRLAISDDGSFYIFDKTGFARLRILDDGSFHIFDKTDVRLSILPDGSFYIFDKTGTRLRILDDGSFNIYDKTGTRLRILDSGSCYIYDKNNVIRLWIDPNGNTFLQNAANSHAIGVDNSGPYSIKSGEKSYLSKVEHLYISAGTQTRFDIPPNSSRFFILTQNTNDSAFVMSVVRFSAAYPCVHHILHDHANVTVTKNADGSAVFITPTYSSRGIMIAT